MALLAKLAKVAPDAQGMTEQKHFVAGVQAFVLFARRRVEPDRDDRSPDPRQQNGRGHQQCIAVVGICRVDDNGRGESYQRREDEIAIDRCAAGGLRFGLGRGFPLQQAIAGNELPNQRTDNRVQAEQRLVGNEDEAEQSELDSVPKPRECLADAPFAAAQGRADETEAALNDGRKEKQKKHDHRPVERASRQSGPPRDKKKIGERLDQRAA